MPPISNDNYLTEVINNVNTLREVVRLTVQTHNQQAQSLLGDYGTYSLASLGGALTFITVAPHLIFTRPLFYIAAVLLITTVIITFITRSQLYSKTNSYLNKVEVHYIKVTGKVGLVRLQNTSENLGALKEISNFNEKLESNWLTRHGLDLAAVLFLVGFLMFACSLIFHITT